MQSHRNILVTCLCALCVIGSLSASAGDLDVVAFRAPVAPDGTTAGAQTDFVLTFRDRDPAVAGIGMQSGGTFTVTLPAAFAQVGPGNIVAALQGWPQSPRIPFPYTTDISGNTITLTMTDDWPVGAFGPGPKQLHLILLDFINPGPGRYDVLLGVDPDGPGGPAAPMSGTTTVEIIPRARPSINVVSIFSGPPGPPPPFFNPLYQQVAPGDTTRQAGLYLWGKDNEPLSGVDLVMTNRAHGRLVRDGYTVGQVRIYTPPKAKAFQLRTLGESIDGIAAVTGVPVGILLVEFDTDPDVSGEYAIALSMNGGNTETLFITAAN